MIKNQYPSLSRGKVYPFDQLNSIHPKDNGMK
jgi:hypothetical protein